MKTMIKIAAVAALLAPGVAMAEQSVEVGGSAEAVCTLPSTWTFESGFQGGTSGQFSGTTWTIPNAQFANSSGVGVDGPGTGIGETAIRVRGAAFCNTSHTITVTSARGGLTQGDASGPAPAGFTKRRPIEYKASWNVSGQTAFGPTATLLATTPGASATATFTVSSSLAPPGNRNFDLRMGVHRPGDNALMVAGAYSDNVTVTIGLLP